MKIRALGIAAVVALGLAAGGASGSSGGTAARQPVTIRLGEYFYKPKVVTVHVGQPVRFVNVGRSSTRSRTLTPREPYVPA
ncbi:MAG: hypothetical protein H0W90_08990 [Actinobacteria bacterium]|nr:hypothetical protein [Actinomycetota bacterium]